MAQFEEWITKRQTVQENIIDPTERATLMRLATSLSHLEYIFSHPGTGFSHERAKSYLDELEREIDNLPDGPGKNGLQHDLINLRKHSIMR
jgi:hypothetical protein